jgi:hypothetical protein
MIAAMSMEILRRGVARRIIRVVRGATEAVSFGDQTGIPAIRSEQSSMKVTIGTFDDGSSSWAQGDGLGGGKVRQRLAWNGQI